MASSRETSNGPDWMDVVQAAHEFGKDWNGVVTVTLRPSGTLKDPVITVFAHLYADYRASWAQKPLASSSVLLSGKQGGDIAAAALSALYELDKEIYRQEIGVSPIRR